MYKFVNVCETLLVDGEFITKTHKAMVLGFTEKRYFIDNDNVLYEGDLADNNVAAKLPGYTWSIWHFESKIDLAKNTLIQTMENYVAFKKKEVEKALGEIKQTYAFLESAKATIKKDISNE